jgi:hypothetical protein
MLLFSTDSPLGQLDLSWTRKQPPVNRLSASNILQSCQASKLLSKVN